MNDTTEEEMPADQVSDEALDAAAGAMNWKPENMTIAFCTGDVSCPFSQCVRSAAFFKFVP